MFYDLTSIGQGRSAVLDIGLPVLRMTSLGGEPKMFGLTIVVALLLLQTTYLFNVGPSKRYRYLWWFFFPTMIMSFSTSAYYVWIGGSIFQVFAVVWAAPTGRVTRGIVRYIFIMIGVTAIIGTFSVYRLHYGSGELPSVERVLEQRLDRRDPRELIPVEDFDEPILDMLLNEPAISFFGTGLGNAHLYAAPYIDPEMWFYGKDKLISPKSGVFWIWAHIGLVGAVLFYGWILSRLFELRRKAYTLEKHFSTDVTSTLLAAITVFFAVMVLAFTARAYVLEYFYLTAGVVEWLCEA
jgi:hypothetical protein